MGDLNKVNYEGLSTKMTCSGAGRIQSSTYYKIADLVYAEQVDDGKIEVTVNNTITTIGQHYNWCYQLDSNNLVIVNNRTNYDAIGNMAGIDVNNLIYDNGSQVASLSYTIPQDGYLWCSTVSPTGTTQAQILIDGVGVVGANNGTSALFVIPIKAGQVITTRTVSGATYRIKLYGLKW